MDSNTRQLDYVGDRKDGIKTRAVGNAIDNLRAEMHKSQEENHRYFVIVALLIMIAITALVMSKANSDDVTTLTKRVEKLEYGASRILKAVAQPEWLNVRYMEDSSQEFRIEDFTFQVYYDQTKGPYANRATPGDILLANNDKDPMVITTIKPGWLVHLSPSNDAKGVFVILDPDKVKYYSLVSPFPDYYGPSAYKDIASLWLSSRINDKGDRVMFTDQSELEEFYLDGSFQISKPAQSWIEDLTYFNK